MKLHFFQEIEIALHVVQLLVFIRHKNFTIQLQYFSPSLSLSLSYSFYLSHYFFLSHSHSHSHSPSTNLEGAVSRRERRDVKRAVRGVITITMSRDTPCSRAADKVSVTQARSVRGGE